LIIFSVQSVWSGSKNFSQQAVSTLESRKAAKVSSSITVHHLTNLQFMITYNLSDLTMIGQNLACGRIVVRPLKGLSHCCTPLFTYFVLRICWHAIISRCF